MHGSTVADAGGKLSVKTTFIPVNNIKSRRIQSTVHDRLSTVAHHDITNCISNRVPRAFREVGNKESTVR